jgi:hypothetical protein
MDANAVPRLESSNQQASKRQSCSANAGSRMRRSSEH